MRADEHLLQLVHASHALGLPLEDTVISLAEIARGIDETGFDPASVWMATRSALVGEYEPIRRLLPVDLIVEGENESERAGKRLRAVADAFRRSFA